MAKHIELILKSLNRYIPSSQRNNLICVSWQKCTSWIRVDKKSFWRASSRGGSNFFLSNVNYVSTHLVERQRTID